MNEEEKQKLREEWHVRSLNMAHEVTDYSKVEGLIADWWLFKLDQALTDKVASIRGEVELAIEVLTLEKSVFDKGSENSTPRDYRIWGEINGMKHVLNNFLSLPASREENG